MYSISYILYSLCSQEERESYHQYYHKRVSDVYNGCLLLHGTGTGKTRCSLQMSKKYPDKPCIILTKKDIVSSWLLEYEKVFGSIDGVHKKNGNCLCPGNYYIMGYKKFENELEKKDLSFYDNVFYIIDESHKIADNKFFFNFFSKTKNTYLCLLTATPCYNHPYEIVDELNLLLVNDGRKPLPTGDTFLKSLGISNYTDSIISNIQDNIVIPKKTNIPNDVKQVWSDYVSYVSPWRPMQKIKVIPQEETKNIVMNPKSLQYKMYQQIEKNIIGTKTSIPNAVVLRSVCCAIFPDQSHGKKGSQKHIENKNGIWYWKKKSLWMKDHYRKDKLGNYSCVFLSILDIIQRVMGDGGGVWIRGSVKGKILIYCEKIFGMIDILSLCLEENGYQQYGSPSSNHSKNIVFSFVCGSSSVCSQLQKKERLDAFANDDIQILIASEVLKEGVTLSDVTDIIFPSGPWTKPTETQVEGRAIRPNAMLNHKYGFVRTYVCSIRNTIEHEITKYADLKMDISNLILDSLIPYSISYKKEFPMDKQQLDYIEKLLVDICNDICNETSNNDRVSTKIYNELISRFVSKELCGMITIQDVYQHQKQIIYEISNILKDITPFYIISTKGTHVTKKRIDYDTEYDRLDIYLEEKYNEYNEYNDLIVNHFLQWKADGDSESPIEYEQIEKNRRNERLKKNIIIEMKHLPSGYIAYKEAQKNCTEYNCTEYNCTELKLIVPNGKRKRGNKNSVNTGKNIKYFMLTELEYIFTCIGIKFKKGKSKSDLILLFNKFYDSQ